MWNERTRLRTTQARRTNVVVLEDRETNDAAWYSYENRTSRLTNEGFGETRWL